MSERLQSFMGPDLSALWADGDKLVASASGGFHDFSFILFPYAKAYEGFLKKFFLRLGAITERQYLSDRWRVGKALNPQLEKELRNDESVYDKIVTCCTNGQQLADDLWRAWKRGRNQVFHFYPEHYETMTFTQAREIVVLMEKAMELALEECKLN